MTIDQERYAVEILRRFNMEEAHGSLTPIAAGTKVQKPENPATAEEKKELEKLPYK